MRDIDNHEAAGRLTPAGIVTPGGVRHDRTTPVWDRRIDRRPAAIVFAGSAGGVQATSELAREHDPDLSVRSAGHNVTGTAVGDGIVFDISGLPRAEVDPNAPQAAEFDALMPREAVVDGTLRSDQASLREVHQCLL
jgi:FAD binding domain